MRCSLRNRVQTVLVPSVWLVLSGAFAAAGEPLDVAFTATLDRTEQRYVVVLPEGFDPLTTHSILVALHGHGSDRWQFVKDGRDECRAARDAAAGQDEKHSWKPA